MNQDEKILEIVKLIKKNPKYSIRYCYNDTGEIIGPNGTYDIFNNLNGAIKILTDI